MIELINEASIKDIQAKYYPNIDIDIMLRLNRLSPDYNEEQEDRKTNYLPWLINRYIKGDETVKGSIENRNMYDMLKSSLLRFEQIKNELPIDKRDINKYSGEGIERLIRLEYKDYLTQKEKKEIIKSESDIVFDSDEWRIVIPRTWKASKFWGTNTKWCTAERDNPSSFNYYTKEGPLYINIDKRNNEKWQFHFESKTFCDSSDENILSDENDEPIVSFISIPEDALAWYQENIDENKYKLLTYGYGNEWPGDGTIPLLNNVLDYDYYLVKSEDSEYYSLEWKSEDDNYIGTSNANFEGESSIIETTEAYVMLKDTSGQYFIIHITDYETGETNLYEFVKSYKRIDYENDIENLHYIIIYTENDGYCGITTISSSFDSDSSLIICNNGYDIEKLMDLWVITTPNDDGTYNIYMPWDSNPVLSSITKDSEDGGYLVKDGYLYTTKNGKKVRIDIDGLRTNFFNEDIDVEELDSENIEEIKIKFWKSLSTINEVRKKYNNDKII